MKKNSIQREFRWLPPSMAAAILILILALAAGINLWFLWTLNRRSMHAAAAKTVVDLGQLMVRQLAQQRAIISASPGEPAWNDFSRLVRSFHEIEPGLYHVSIAEQGQVLFHLQLGEQPPSAGNEEAISRNGILVDRRLLASSTGTGAVPVLTFTLQVSEGFQPSRSVQVAIRKDRVDIEESTATRAMARMFRLALSTISISFGLAVVVVVWIIRRDLKRQAVRQAEEHLAFAGVLADGIFHDVRNPMSSLKLDIQLLEKETTRETGARPERLQELAGRTRITIERIDRVMEEFLFVSRPDRRLPESLDVQDLLRETQELVGPHFEEGGITLLREGDSAPITVNGYPLALKRALVNVLMNARQAAPVRSVVMIRVYRETPWVAIDIEDAGPGIPPEMRSKVFDLFFTGRTGGTGLGLSLAKAAVEKSGGVIMADERQGGGTRMTIRLPLAEEHHE